MTSDADIRSAIDAATVPEEGVLERARMIVVDKLGEWDSLGLDEIVESVCEAYEAPSGERLRVSDVDPADPTTDSPALRSLRYSRAARTAVIDLQREGTIVAVDEQPGDAEAVGETAGGTGGGTGENRDDDDEATTTKETTGPAAEKAGTDEVLLSTGPQPRGRRFALAAE
ncbi:hypothetical protein [Rhodococcus sp. IEGM 1408]|uniref:hypothetical protein n=1 Tax=Rhodococcus sp. IEGM 1408 TaxID=3082220 RepID=UPI0029549833|nr:hypothetical protein [Rhodococcus sp. IEGM 1408]MDV8001806.1 hypothetical protein [Rhodococcus sp. IEGM 1408]